MTRRIDHVQLLAHDELVSAPEQRACDNHSFEMPTAVYATMGALFFGFMAVMALGFAHPELAVPMGINFAFLTAFFAVPAIFVGAKGSSGRALGWSEFMREGIATATGRSGGAEAVVLTLLLPFLIFCWSIAIVVIAAV